MLYMDILEEFENGSDHAVVASYSELYEEGEVEISTVYGQC